MLAALALLILLDKSIFQIMNYLAYISWCLLPPPIKMGGLNLKTCQDFVEQVFSYICGGINLYGGSLNYMDRAYFCCYRF